VAGPRSVTCGATPSAGCRLDICPLIRRPTRAAGRRLARRPQKKTKRPRKRPSSPAPCEFWAGPARQHPHPRRGAPGVRLRGAARRAGAGGPPVKPAAGNEGVPPARQAVICRMARLVYRGAAERLQPISKPHVSQNCHSERSEESRIFKYLRPFASLRVTKNEVLKWLLKNGRGHLRVPPFDGGHAGPPLQKNCRLTAPWY